MSLGSNLLELQRIDLELTRTRQSVSALPILRELSKKRSSHAKLKAESTRLLAQRKDAEIDLADLDSDIERCRAEVLEAQSTPIDASDYRQVQDLELKLSDLAKRIDKCTFDRQGAVKRLEEAREKEAVLLSYIERFEQGIVDDTRLARSQASELQNTIDELEAERARLASRIPVDTLQSYEAASKRFGGLGVEKLEGRVPSICRTTLQPASMDELRHAGDIAECPYCHRMIITNEVE